MSKTLFFIALFTLFGTLLRCTPIDPFGDINNIYGRMRIVTPEKVYGPSNPFTDSTGASDTIVIEHYLPNFIAYAEVQMAFGDDSVETLFRTYDSTFEQDSLLSSFLLPDNEYVRVTFKKEWTFYRSGEYCLFLHIKDSRGVDKYFDTIRVSMFCSTPRIKRLFSDEYFEELRKGDTTGSLWIDVGNELDSIVFNPLPQNPYTTITINEIDTRDSTAGAPVTLHNGENTFVIVCTADDETITDTTVVTIYRKASSDAALKRVDIPEVRFDTAFTFADTFYSVIVPVGVRSITVDASSMYPEALLSMGDTISSKGELTGTVPIVAAVDTLVLSVAAADETTLMKYYFELVREKDTCTTLDGISVGSNGCSLDFSSDKHVYSCTVENIVTTMQLSFLRKNEMQQLSVRCSTSMNDSMYSVIYGEYDSVTAIPLKSKDTNYVFITVNSEAGDTGLYVLLVYRIPSKIATLDSILSSAGRVVRISEYTYELFVPYGYTSVKLSPVPTNAQANIGVEDTNVFINTLAGPYEKKALKPGINAGFRITVDSEDETMGSKYQITRINCAYRLTIDTANGAAHVIPTALDVYKEYPALVKVTAVEGYAFNGWTIVKGTAKLNVPQSDSTTILVDSNCTIKPVMVRKKYAVHYTIRGEGVVEGLDSIEHGISAGITALPGKGFMFSHWGNISPGVVVGDTSAQSTSLTSCSFEVAVEAVFVPVTYRLTVDAGEHGTILKKPDVQIVHGTTVEVAAQSDSGYHFSGWKLSDGGYAKIDDPASATTKVLMDSSDATVTAQFSINTYYLDKTAEHGTVSTMQPVSETDSLNYGEAAIVVAIPDSGYTFVGWECRSGEMSIGSPYADTTTVVLRKGNAHIHAKFTLKMYKLIFCQAGDGTIPPDDTVEHGAHFKMFAKPAEGYRFVTWTVTSGNVFLTDSTIDTCEAILSNGDAAVKAVFERIRYTFSVAAGENGKVIGVTGIAQPGTAIVDTAEHGVSLTLNAVPDAYYHLTNWKIESGIFEMKDSLNDSVVIGVLSENVSAEAMFAINTYSVGVGSTGKGTVTGGGSGTYLDFLPLTATPDMGYLFSGWDFDAQMCTLGDSANPVTWVYPKSDVFVQAVFKPTKYGVSVTVEGNGWVNDHTDILTAEHGIGKEITANPDTLMGYHFDCWKTTTPAVVTFGNPKTAVTTVTVIDSMCSITAVFSLNRYLFATSITGKGSIKSFKAGDVIIMGGDSVTHGDSVLLIAEPDTESSVFDRWKFSDSMGTGDTSDMHSYVTINGNNTSIEARFKLKEYELTVMQPELEECGSIEPVSIKCQHNVQYPIRAKTGKYFYFAGWKCVPVTNAAIVDPTAESTMIQLTGIDTLYAQFNRIPRRLYIDSSGGNGAVKIGANFATGNDSLLSDLWYELKAESHVGSSFDHWKIGGGVGVSSESDSFNNSINVKLTDTDGSITAVFKKNTYVVKLVAGENGTIDPPEPDSITVQYGVPYILKAKPLKDYGYMVDNWSSNAMDPDRCVLVQDDTTCSLTVTALQPDLTITVTFKKRTWKLSINRVATIGGTIDLPKEEILYVEHAQRIPINAIPDSGFKFSTWKKEGLTTTIDNPDRQNSIITLYCNATLWAEFDSIKNRVYLETDTSGERSIADSLDITYFEGKDITAKTINGYRFVEWAASAGITLCSLGLTETKVSTTVPGTVTARYIRIIDTLTVLHSDFCELPDRDTVYQLDYGTVKEITAKPLDQYDFVRWNVDSGKVFYGDGFYDTMATTHVYCTGNNAKLQPVCTLKKYTLSVSQNRTDYDALVTVDNDVQENKVEWRVEYTCSASVQYPLRFVKWRTTTPSAIEIRESTNPVTIFSCTGDAYLEAEFDYCSFALELSTNMPLGATVSSSGGARIRYGDTVILTADVKPGYKMLGWQVIDGDGLTFGDVLTSTELPIVFKPPELVDSLKIMCGIAID